MTFRICSGFTVLFVCLKLLLMSIPVFADTTQLISVSSTGVKGNSYSGGACISADGRYIAFSSESTNLVAGDTNGKCDVFIRDLINGTTELVSISSTGEQGNDRSGGQSISADGRYIAFCSDASNFVDDDTNGLYTDIFVRDRLTGTTKRVNVSSAGEQAIYYSYSPSITGDGRYVVFSSDAPNLVTGDSNGLEDVFIRDIATGTTELVSVSSAGAQGNNTSDVPSISTNGRYVVFCSKADNLVAGDTNIRDDIFVRDLVAHTTERISVSPTGVQGDANSNHYVSISVDGRYVAFFSFASNLVGDNISGSHIYVRDMFTGTNKRVSVSSAGTPGNLGGYDPSLSANGRYISFASGSTNFVAVDNNEHPDIFVRDMLMNTTERVSVTSSGQQVFYGGDAAVISSDGRYVVFTSWADDLVAGDTNYKTDVFLRDRAKLPINKSLTPNSGKIVIDQKTTLSSTYTDLIGYEFMKRCYLMMNTGSTVTGAGYIFYDAPTNKLYMRKTDDTGNIGGYAPGSAHVVDNGAIILYCADTTIQNNGNDMTVNWSIGLKPYFTGNTCTASMQVTNKANLTDPMEQMGSFQTCTRKPDLLIKTEDEVSYSGIGVFNADGSDQTKSQNTFRDQTATYSFNVRNAGDIDDSFTITGPGGGNGWTVSYYDIDTNAEVTSQVTGSGWSSGTLVPGEGNGIYANVKPDSTVLLGSAKTMLITATSEILSTKIDVVKAVTTCIALRKPDMLIKSGTESSYSGTDVFSTDGNNQTKSQGAAPGQKITYTFKVRNAGEANDSFRITGPSGGSGWSVRYYDLLTSAEVTSQVTGTGWLSGTLAPGVSKGIFVKITPDASVTLGSVNTLLITAASEADNSKIDVVKTVTSFIGSYKTDMIIKAGSETKYTGTGIFNTDGTNQTKLLNVCAGQKVAYTFRAQNAGNANDSFRITGTAGGSGWSVKYYDVATNAEVTSQVTGAGWVSGTVAPKGYPGVYANVKPDASVPLGSTITLTITGRSESDNAKTDVVKAVTTCVASYQPDMLIKNSADASYIGTDIINTDGANQSKSQNASAGQKATYSFRVKNAGYLSDSFTITGTAGGSGWSVRYYDLSSVEITSQVTGAGWSSGTLASGVDRGFFVKVAPDASVGLGASKTLLITATSVGSGTKKDVVKSITPVP